MNPFIFKAMCMCISKKNISAGTYHRMSNEVAKRFTKQLCF